jgi:hypothetical protein
MALFFTFPAKTSALPAAAATLSYLIRFFVLSKLVFQM